MSDYEIGYVNIKIKYSFSFKLIVKCSSSSQSRHPRQNGCDRRVVSPYSRSSYCTHLSHLYEINVYIYNEIY